MFRRHFNQPAEALKLAERAQELEPDNPNFQDTLGWVLYKKGLYQNAVTHLQSAVAKTKGKDVRLQYHLAMACFKGGDETRGKKVLEAALKLDPSPIEAKQARELFQSTSAARLAP